MNTPIILLLQTLPRGIAAEAIRNLNKDTDNQARLKRVYGIEDLAAHEVPSLRAAVNYAFDWFKSPEGFGYWNSIYDELEDLNI